MLPEETPGAIGCNALRNPVVAVNVAGQRFTGIASLVADCAPRQKISQLKYGGRRNLGLRTVIQITPGGAQKQSLILDGQTLRIWYDRSP